MPAIESTDKSAPVFIKNLEFGSIMNKREDLKIPIPVAPTVESFSLSNYVFGKYELLRYDQFDDRSLYFYFNFELKMSQTYF